MRNLFIVSSLLITIGSPFYLKGQSYREMLHEIPLDHLKALPKMAESEDRKGEWMDRFIIREDDERGFFALKQESAGDINKLLFLSKDGANYVCIEYSDCHSRECEGEFSILKKNNNEWVEIELFDAFDFKIKRQGRKLEKAYEDVYGSNNRYLEEGYEDEAVLLKKLVWIIDNNRSVVYLREHQLPYDLITLEWNPEKERFEEIKN